MGETKQNGTVIDKATLFAKPADLLSALQRILVFANLREDQLHCFDEAELLEYPADTVVVPQNGQEHFYWIFLEGSLHLSQIQADGRDVTITSIDEPTAMGEVPILSNSPNPASVKATSVVKVLRLPESGFWRLMIECPMVRQKILEAMAWRTQRLQTFAQQQDKLASLGTLVAGLMHELNNPGAAAQRAAAQLRENLVRLQELSLLISRRPGSPAQKECIADLQERALVKKSPVEMNSLEQSDAEEALAEWLEGKKVENAWRLAPTLVGMGIQSQELDCAGSEFPGNELSDVLNWLEALVSSVQLVGTIEESVGRMTELVRAVKSYAYEGKGHVQQVDVNQSIISTVVILKHKLREKNIGLEKSFGENLPTITTASTGLNQVWTNLLDNAADAITESGTPNGVIKIRTWAEGKEVCVSIADNGAGIPQSCQAHIFEPFYTTKEVGVGTGLGLDIAHRIVAQQYGGHISFTSEPGHTEFVIRLPKERN